jgi:hypothetical protein
METNKLKMKKQTALNTMNIFKHFKLIALFGFLLSSCDKEAIIEDEKTSINSAAHKELYNLVSNLNNKNKKDEPPVELNYFDWASEALINYHYRFTNKDTSSFTFRDTSFTISVEVIQLDSNQLDYYVEIPQVMEFLVQLNNEITSRKPVDYSPAIIDIRRIGIDNSSETSASYSVLAIYKKPNYSIKSGIQNNDPTFLSFSSQCPGGMPAEAARNLINDALNDHYYGQFPSWSTQKISGNINGIFFTDICWGNINGSTLPNPSEGKCIDTYTCNAFLFGHSNCGIAPLNKNTCISLQDINANMNSAITLSSFYKPSPSHQVAHCNLLDGWLNYTSNNIYFYNRVYYGIPTSIPQMPAFNFL